MSRKFFVAAGAVIFLVLLGVFFLSGGNGAGPEYKTSRISKGDITDSVSATGRVSPVVSVSVGTQVSGTIKRIYVDYNDRVKKGQVLIELDREVYESRVKEAESELRARRAQHERASVEFLKEESEFKRIEELFNKGFISRTEYETADYGTRAGKASVEIALAELQRAEAALEVARENLSKTIIRSPVEGVVLTRDVDEGQTVSASLQAPTLLTVGDLARMQIYASVDEADIGKIREGQEVLFYVDSFPERQFRGEVSKMHYSPTIEQSVVTYDVLVYFDNEGLVLRPGMTATVDVIMSGKKGVLLLPNRALRVRMPGAEKSKTRGPVAWVLEEGRPVAHPVKLGMGDEENTEVLEGLTEGDTVVVESPPEARRRRFGFRGFH